jgi:GNAT superfamily N-acetyltransferase
MTAGAPTQPTLRPATLNDAASIATLNGELGYPVTADEMAPRLASLLDVRDHAVLVAETDGSVIAWIQVSVVATVESGSFAEIRGLVVTAAHRSRGVGARLVEAAEGWARERGLTRIRVRSNVARERTHAFYERLGYQTTKLQKVFDKRI